VPVAGLLDGERWVGADRHLFALAVQVVLEAPGLGAGRQDLEQQAAAVGQRIGLLARLGVVDRERAKGVVDVPHCCDLAEVKNEVMAPFGPKLSEVCT
jgi:hypothetical protein